MTVTRMAERDIDGQLFNFSVYLLIAAVFLIGVVEIGWRSRFLLATGFFVSVGLMSLMDMITANQLATGASTSRSRAARHWRSRYTPRRSATTGWHCSATLDLGRKRARSPFRDEPAET
ncbi:MAG: hypothetical protein R3E48_23120 [Burkholderiaceae bacterium]